MKKALLLVVLSVTACSGRKAVWDTEPAAPSPGAAAQPAEADAEANGDALWAERSDVTKLRAAIDIWTEVANADPANADVLVKLTRAHYFLADGFLREDDTYLDVLDQGVKWGEKAVVAASPEFGKAMADGAKLPDAMALVGKDGVPAMYWYAGVLGRWAKAQGFAVLLGQKDNVKATMLRCLELEPTYFHGGPHRYVGTMYAVAPAFAGGDLGKSKEHFETSLEIEPNYVGTKVLWATELAVKQQDEETFDRLLAEVLATDDNVIPEVAAETRVEKEKARELQANRDEYF
jgi:hypothetical protein